MNRRRDPGSTGACPQESELDAYCHGGLSEPERERIGRHLDECESCRNFSKIFETGFYYGGLLRATAESTVVPEHVLETASQVHSTFMAGGNRPTTKEAEEHAARIKELIEHLPAEYGAVLEQCLVKGLSFDEAGEELGVSADVVRQRYQGVREILQRKKGG